MTSELVALLEAKQTIHDCSLKKCYVALHVKQTKHKEKSPQIAHAITLQCTELTHYQFFSKNSVNKD